MKAKYSFTNLAVSKPLERVYQPTEDYRFLVHVSLGNVEKRFAEIGSKREGVLATSLVTNRHQGTFCGEGGLILSSPKTQSIRGMSRVDCGGEIKNGRKDYLQDLLRPAKTSEYNQVDLTFEGVRVAGVMLKTTAAGRALGNSERNAALIQLAQAHDLPVVTIVVMPSSPPATARIIVHDDSGRNRLVTYDFPYDDNRFLRVDVAHGTFYHSPGRSVIARSMIIDRYGQVSQVLTSEQKQLILDKIQSKVDCGELDISELRAVKQGWRS
ncbi:MAG TPA: hypothetical protein VF733_06935 [Candidatus Saccharimonadales bacterium]